MPIVSKSENQKELRSASHMLPSAQYMRTEHWALNLAVLTHGTFFGKKAGSSQKHYKPIELLLMAEREGTNPNKRKILRNYRHPDYQMCPLTHRQNIEL